jgi:peptidoglycan/LPS O-acetylase OafA/YrhL
MTYQVASPIPRLTAFRGVAAAGIVVFHLAVAFELGDSVISRADFLKVAVTFFFVLSGFVLTHSDSFHTRGQFLMARAARLLPLYVVAWLIALAGRSWLHWIPSQTELIASLLVVQAWVPDPDLAMAVNPVGWSLSCEMACYLALPFIAPAVLRASQRRLTGITAAVAAWLAVGAVATSWVPIEWWVGYRASEFAAGVVLAAWLRRGWVPGASSAIGAALSAGLVCVWIVLGTDVSVPLASLVAIPSIIVVIARAATARRGVSPSVVSRAGEVLGRWSYALYLSHWIVVVLISRFGSEPWRVALAVIASVAAAGVLCEAVERPARRRLLRWARRAPGAASSGQATAHGSVAAPQDANLKAL